MISRCSTGSQVATSAIRGVLKKLKADKNPRLALLDVSVPETFQQVSARKIAFAEQVLVECSVSEAFDEKHSRQHQHTGCIWASHGMRDEVSRFRVH